MGVFIHLLISKSVTKREWESVYEETLKLVDKLPFAEIGRVAIHGVETFCLIRTKESEIPYRWGYKRIGVGWRASGDYTNVESAEDYFLPKNLVNNTEMNENAGDAILGALPAYMPYDWNDERLSQVYRPWGNKTQGESYHMYLLAVAILIEARLGPKAFTYGDITEEQLERAVEIANQYLTDKIELPDRCDMERLSKRVKNLPLSEQEQYDIFKQFYFGMHDDKYRQFICRNFSENVVEDYWKNPTVRQKTETESDQIIEKYYIWRKEYMESYDITRYNELKYYENGDTIKPVIKKLLVDIRKFMNSVIEKEKENEIMYEDTHKKCSWIVQQNKYICIRDLDWEKVFSDIEEHPDSFKRYYSIFRVDMKQLGISDICTGLLLNDDLYAYSEELVTKFEEDSTGF